MALKCPSYDSLHVLTNAVIFISGTRAKGKRLGQIHRSSAAGHVSVTATHTSIQVTSRRATCQHICSMLHATWGNICGADSPMGHQTRRQRTQRPFFPSKCNCANHWSSRDVTRPLSRLPPFSPRCAVRRTKVAAEIQLESSGEMS